ncbi:MAG: acyl--CoA ligase [Micromonosporaceae bacterium]|nr:acyl--CoA ligase [Micromonosporaceae bacterium]
MAAEQDRDRNRNVSDYLLSNGASDEVALTDAGRHYSYAELRSAAGIVAAELLALGLPPGARVAIVGENSLFWIAGYLATMKLNLVAVPLSHKSSSQDVGQQADLVGCTAVLIDRRELRRFGAAFGASVLVVTDEVLRSGRTPYWPPAQPCDPDTDAVLMFTSGTTSRPRAVRVTHGNIVSNTESILAVLGLRATDRVLVILPFFYCFGASLLHTHLRVGARLVLCTTFVFPETAIELLEREQCTVFAGVPSSFNLLLRAGGFARRALPSLRLIQQAGGPLPRALVEEVRAAQPSAELFIMYGQTEATARLSILPPALLTERAGSIGRGIPGVELRVLDEQGGPVAPGVRGEIYARGANISPGYFGDPEESASKFTQHGLRTGDLAIVDSDGYVFIVDRRDDFIKSWGHRVSSQEIEAVAAGMEQLAQVAVVGVPDAQAGEAITLFVTPRPGARVSPDEVLAFCSQRLARHRMPRSVLVVDTLPVNASGKILKARLREMAAVGQAPQPRQ